MGIMDSLGEEFRTRNFSIYGQWLGILSMIISLATGISSIFTFHPITIPFAIVAIIFALLILFIEVPFLLRICPTSSTFDAAIRRISTNWMRAGAYAAMSVVLFLSCLGPKTSLIAAGVFLALTAIAYFLAAVKGQSFVGSKTLGGQGVAQMIV